MLQEMKSKTSIIMGKRTKGEKGSTGYAVQDY